MKSLSLSWTRRLLRGNVYTGPRRRPTLELLEARTLLTGNPPFSVGGDPIVNPADFRITTFASGLNYPHGMTTLTDGSLLVGLSNPLPGFTDYFDTTGQLLRLVDANGDGVADDAGTVLYDGLPGEITALHEAGPYILATSSLAGSERISFLHIGAAPSDPLTLVGSINFAFPPGWEHTTFASAVAPLPGLAGTYQVLFNIGSQYNGVVIGNDGSVVLDANGNPTYEPTTGTVQASGLTTGTLRGDSIYWTILRDNNGTPLVSNPAQIASGLRNAAGLAIDPVTGKLYIGENGIDGNDFGNEAWSADELDSMFPAPGGGQFTDFGFPYSYTKTIDAPGDPVVVVNPGRSRQPLVAFEPLADPVLTQEGSESEGPSGFALSPTQFPAGLNQGVFIGFHGIFNEGGNANDENPLVFADLKTGHFFDFISNNEPNIGHLDEALSTSDSLFLADISSTGDVFGSGGPGQGMIYQIKAISQQPLFVPTGKQTAEVGRLTTQPIHATAPVPAQALGFSQSALASPEVTFALASGLSSWTSAGSSTASVNASVAATDKGGPSLGSSRSNEVTARGMSSSRLVNQGIAATDAEATGLLGVTALDGTTGIENAGSGVVTTLGLFKKSIPTSNRFHTSLWDT